MYSEYKFEKNIKCHLPQGLFVPQNLGVGFICIHFISKNLTYFIALDLYTKKNNHKHEL